MRYIKMRIHLEGHEEKNMTSIVFHCKAFLNFTSNKLSIYYSVR